MSPVRILHVFSTFAPGGPQVRTTGLMQALGSSFQHEVVAMDGVTSAASRVGPDVNFTLLDSPPRPVRTPAAVRWAGQLLAMRKPDLLITYNWGAIEAAMAAALRGQRFIHCEDGFGAEEAERRLPRRIWTRRLVLAKARAVVVPSRTLERIALTEYKVSRGSVRYIPNGIDVSGYTVAAGSGGTVIGTVGHLRPEKNFGLLLEAFARLSNANARLLMTGAGPCEPELRAQAEALGCADRVIWAGHVADPRPQYNAMDIFALTSSTEQMPLSLLEAMASGLPCVCTNVGDCAEMLGSGHPPAIVPPGGTDAVTKSFETLLADGRLRSALGAANRLRCEEHYSKSKMVESYRSLNLEAAGR